MSRLSKIRFQRRVIFCRSIGVYGGAGHWAVGLADRLSGLLHAGTGDTVIHGDSLVLVSGQRGGLQPVGRWWHSGGRWARKRRRHRRRSSDDGKTDRRATSTAALHTDRDNSAGGGDHKDENDCNDNRYALQRISGPQRNFWETASEEDGAPREKRVIFVFGYVRRNRRRVLQHPGHNRESFNKLNTEHRNYNPVSYLKQEKQGHLIRSPDVLYYAVMSFFRMLCPLNSFWGR